MNVWKGNLMRKTDNWLYVPAFSDKYGISSQHVHVTIRQKDPFWIKKFDPEPNKKLRRLKINEDYLIRALDFQDKIYTEAQDWYYTFTEDHTEYVLAGYLAEWSDHTQESWSSFLYKRLFTPKSERATMLSIRTPKMYVEMVRIMRRHYEKEDN